MNWLKGFQGKIRVKEPLKKHTTFKIGGGADYFLQPKDCSDLQFVLRQAKKRKIPLAVIGAGSNILAADKALRLAVISLSSAYFKNIRAEKNRIFASSGVSLAALLKEARRRSLGGVEFLSGIPGTVGGALAMNAGAWGRSIGDLVEEVRVMDYNGLVSFLKKADCKFGYRCGIDGRYIILGAKLRLKKMSKRKIEELSGEFVLKRKASQDQSLPNAGCIFKNPPGSSAGRLIDACGLKGRTLGKALISRRHANFFLARKGAKAEDILGLMRLARDEVKKKFNIALEPEIKIWD